MYGADGQENIPHREWIRMFEEVMNEVKDEMKTQGRGDEFIGARVWILQYSCDMILKRSVLDYLHHHQIYHPRRAGMVHRRLPSAQERIPTYDCR